RDRALARELAATSRLCGINQHNRDLASLRLRAATSGCERESRLDQLEEHHLGGVRAARAELHDAGVAAVAVGVTGRDLLEELVNQKLVLAELGERLPARVQIAALAERDQLLEMRLDSLRLGIGDADALVVDDLTAEVAHQRLAMRSRARELSLLLCVAHGFPLKA